MGSSIPLVINTSGNTLELILNNPDKRNALNSEIMGALVSALEGVPLYNHLRAVVIRGEGSVFCSGAEVSSWKPRELQSLLRSIVDCPIPTIVYAHGACLGGGMGIACASDFVLADEATKFGFPEVRIGMIPSIISPYIARKLSINKMRELFITGEKFDTSAAISLGLVYRVSKNNREKLIQSLLTDIEKGAPIAQRRIKGLLNSDTINMPIKERDLELSKLISEIRKSEEGKEGLNSFLEKRKPNWVE